MSTSSKPTADVEAADLDLDSKAVVGANSFEGSKTLAESPRDSIDHLESSVCKNSEPVANIDIGNTEMEVEDVVTMDGGVECHEDGLSPAEENIVVVTSSTSIDEQVQPTYPASATEEMEPADNSHVEKVDGGHLKSGSVPETGRIKTDITCDVEEDFRKAQTVKVNDVNNKVDLATENASTVDNSMNVSDKTTKQTTLHDSASNLENQDQVRYYFPMQEEDGFAPFDLVWGKVKSHPWWPGQIFDSSYASEMALKHHRKEGVFLVAYFGDKTFAWCEDSQLKPFQKNFSQLEKQSTSDIFLRAIDEALNEASRRVQLELACACLPKDTYADIKYQKVENAGIEEGFCRSVIDKPHAVDFRPSCLLDYIHMLAQFPKVGADRLDLVIAKAQLRAFYRTKGFSELPTFLVGGSLDDSKQMAASNVNEYERNATDQSAAKSRKSRGRKRKNIEEECTLADGKKKKSLAEMIDDEDVIDDERDSQSGGEIVSHELPELSGKKHNLDYTGIEMGKEKSLESVAEQESKSPSVTSNGSFKVGEWIRRAANSLTVSHPLVKPSGENIRKGTIQGDDIMDDHFPDDAFLDTPLQDPSGKKHVSEDYQFPEELLSQLCLAASDPMTKYSFVSSVVGFFTEVRNHSASFSDGSRRGRKRKPSIKVESRSESPETSPASSPKKGRRGRKKKVDPCLDDSYLAQCNLVSIPVSSDVTPDHMKDSYWSDIVFHDNPGKEQPSNSLKRSTQRRRQKIKQDVETAQIIPSVSALESSTSMQIGASNSNTTHEWLGERPKIILEERIVEERTPTALVFNFSKADLIPSEAVLIRIFSRYGPLKESETAVHRKSKHAKVVFKKRADAEVAFSSTGKYSIFGPALLSYRLKNLPLNPEDFPSAQQEDQGDTVPAEHQNVEALVPRQAGNGETIREDSDQAENQVSAMADVVDVQEAGNHAQQHGDEAVVVGELAHMETRVLSESGSAQTEIETLAHTVEDQVLFQSETAIYGEEDPAQPVAEAPTVGELAEVESAVLDMSHSVERETNDNELADPGVVEVTDVETSLASKIGIEESMPLADNSEGVVLVVGEPGQPDEEASKTVEPVQAAEIEAAKVGDSGERNEEALKLAEPETESIVVGDSATEGPFEANPGQSNEEAPMPLELVQASELEATVLGDSGQPNEEAPQAVETMLAAETETVVVGDSGQFQAIPGQLNEVAPMLAEPAETDVIEIGNSGPSEAIAGQPIQEALKLVESVEAPETQVTKVGDLAAEAPLGTYPDQVESGSSLMSEPESVGVQGHPDEEASLLEPGNPDEEASLLEPVHKEKVEPAAGLGETETEPPADADLGQMETASSMEAEPASVADSKVENIARPAGGGSGSDVPEQAEIKDGASDAGAADPVSKMLH